MDQSDLIMDLSDDDEDNVVRTIQLQKSLISESESLTNKQAELIDLDRQPQDLDGPDSEINQNNEESSVNDDETMYREALAANVQYDNHLARLETNLKRLISECKSNLEEVSNIREDYKREKKVCSASGKSTHLYVFGAPYFKDKDYYPCPPNADTVKKMQNNELCLVDLPAVRWWTPLQTKQLVDGIKELAFKASLRDANNEKKTLVRTCSGLGENDVEERKKLQNQINEFDIKEVAQANLNEKIASMDHDWLNLSVSILNGKHTSEECKGFWYNYLHPKFHKGQWTEEEEEKLGTLAEEHSYQNWDLIAEKLGTNRSGYQCFAHFRSDASESVKQKWTKEEDDILKAVVERLKVGDYIPWSQVAVNMKGRSKTQVYNRWSYSINPKIKKGRFTVQEDIVILRGVQLWGEDFQKIAAYMPDRTAPQIRTRYHTGIAKTNFAPWSLSEDKVILDLVRKHGHNWVQISKHLPGRLSVQIRRRHLTLVKWIEAHPGKNLSEITSRRSLKTSIYDCHPEIWTYADKLLSSGNPKAISTSLATSKILTTAPKGTRIKKRSLIDEKLYEYFQGTYQPRPVFTSRKFTPHADCDPNLVSNVALFLEILGAKLNIPPDDELEEDKTLDDEDRQILKALRTFHPKVLEDSSDTSPPLVEHNTVTAEDSPLSEVDPLNLDIDYVPKCDPTSTQVQLEFSFNGDFHEAVIVDNEPVTPEAPLVPTDSTLPLFGGLKYICPPNVSTLVGLRSILLGKRKLVESISEYATDPILSDIDDTYDTSYQRASHLWEDRLMCLFALPNLLTKLKPPASVTSTGDSPGTSGLHPLRVKLDADSEVEVLPSTSDVFRLNTMVSDKDGSVYIRVGEKRKNQNARSGAALAKRRRGKN